MRLVGTPEQLPLNYKGRKTIIEDSNGRPLLNNITQDTEFEIKGFYKGYGDGNRTFLGIDNAN